MTKAPYKASTFRLGPDLDAAIERLFERDGISPSEQARRAFSAFLTEKGVYKAPAASTAPRKRAKKGGA